MFMILMLHVNVFSIGSPDSAEVLANPISASARIFFQRFAIIAVDLFVLISGWFGIKYTNRGLIKFFYQALFFAFVATIIGWYCGDATTVVEIIKSCCFFTSLWFVVAYAGLYILSPVLNSFVQQSSKKQLGTTLILFYIFQTWFGVLYPSSVGFSGGYSIISFVGLYLLARYVKLYGEQYLKYGAILWLISLCTLLFLVFLRNFSFGKMVPDGFINNYNSPFVVSSALGFFMMIARMKPRHNKVINWIASSAFSVYLLHMGSGWTVSSYKSCAQYIFNAYSGLEYLAIISAFMLAVYVIALLLDQLRKLTWDWLLLLFSRKEN